MFRILSLKLRQEFQDVGFGYRLAVGQSLSSLVGLDGRFGLLGFYRRGRSGLGRVANFAELAMNRYAGADNFAGAGVYGCLRVRIGDISAGVSRILQLFRAWFAIMA